MRQTQMRLFFATTALALTLSTFWIPVASACQCVARPRAQLLDPDVARAVAQSDYVFFGQVLREHGTEVGIKLGASGWDFAVAAVWKGDIGRRTTIFAHSQDGTISSCDFDYFETGKTYVVFGYFEDGAPPTRLRVHSCSLTMQIEPDGRLATEIVGRLGDPKIRPPR